MTNCVPVRCINIEQLGCSEASMINTDKISDTHSIMLFKRAYLVSDRTVILVIMVAAILLRVMSAVYQGNNVTNLPGIYDQISYDGLARRIVQGYGFSFGVDSWPVTRAGEPTAHWSYLYTLYLATIYKLFGMYPVIARLIQAVAAGILQTILIRRLGNRLFGRDVGLIAAALNAVYIYFFYYAGALITETFYITCILWTFDAGFRVIDRDARKSGPLLWIELGMAIAMTVLLRQLFLLFLPFFFIWLWWNLPDEKTGRWMQILHWSAIKGLLIVTIVLGLAILPFTIRNYRAFGTFVLLNTNAGFAFYWGNHPIHGTHFMPLLSVPGMSYQDLIPPNLLSLNEGMLDKTLLKLGIQFVLDDPVRFALLSVSRIEEYIKFWPSRDSGLLSNISRVGSFGILLPFMLYGLWAAFSMVRSPVYPRQRANLIILYLFIAAYSFIHFLSWTLIRYRLPVDAILILFAGYSVDVLIQKMFAYKGNQ